MLAASHRSKRRSSRAIIEACEPRQLLAFTLVSIPDTQYAAETFPTQMTAQTQWAVDHAASNNIAFVTQLGDLTRRGYSDYQMGNADAAFDLLNGVLPYSVAMGNHDYDAQFDNLDSHMSSANFAEWFGSARYAGKSWHGGSTLDQRNHFQVFNADGRDYLHLNLEWEPSDAVLAWAQGVINSHRQMPAILSTHSYLSSSSGRNSGVVDGGNSGEQVFQELVKVNPQIFLVLCGHGGERHQTSTNNAGSSVFEMVADYSDPVSGGNAWMQLLNFDTANNRIDVTTYSPTLNQYQTDSNSQFSLTINFAQRFAFYPAGAPVGNDDAYAVLPGASVNGSVLANDYDTTALTASLLSGPAHGGLLFNTDGTFTYTPTPGYSGADSFTYTASDGTSTSNTATVKLTVNTAPTASPDAVDTYEAKNLVIAVLANDLDADGNALKPVLVSLPSNGTVVPNANGSFTYYPNPRFTGTDSFSYAASDGSALSALATVTVNVLPNLPNYNTATAQTNTQGTFTGGFANTAATDGVVVSIREVTASGGDSLEGRWTFNVTPGTDVTFWLNAWMSPGYDEFYFEYSTNGSTWTRLKKPNGKDFEMTRNRSDANGLYQMASMPSSLSGTVYVRTIDTLTGGTGLSTIYIDEMLIVSGVGAPDTQAPTAPTNLAVTGVTSTGVSLSWTASTDNVGVTGYEIWRDGVKVATTASTSYTNTGLAPSTSYTYLVKAYDAKNNVSEPSNSVVATTAVANVPAAPSNLTASVLSRRRVKLTWRDNSTDESGFYVYRSSDGINWTRIATVGAKSGSGSNQTYTTGTLTAGRWYFKVTAYNGDDESASTNVLSVQV